MSKFKVGDIVRTPSGRSDLKVIGYHGGEVYDLERVASRSGALLGERYYREFCDYQWTLVKTNNNNTIMDLKNKFVSIFLTEPEKSFRKSGVTNGDGILTPEGQEVFLTWLLKKHGTEFKTEVVDEILKEGDDK